MKQVEKKSKQPDADFYTGIIRLIKQGRAREALMLTREVRKIGGKSSYIFSLEGMAYATMGDYKNAALWFLHAYAQSRNPLYRRQLEEVLPKVYGEMVYPLDSVDFVSFFKERRAKLGLIEPETERFVPDLENQDEDTWASAYFEEVMADRGIWVAEDRDLEVVFLNQCHSLPITDQSFLIEKAHETPPFSDAGPFTREGLATGTNGTFAAYAFARTALCREDSLKKCPIEEEGVYIGGSANIGHFLLDFLPKIDTWLASKNSQNLPVYTYNLSGFCRVITDALYPEIRFIDLTTVAPSPSLLQFKHVHVPSYLPAGYSFQILQERARRSGFVDGDDAGPLVYLSRGLAYRRITNEDELIERMKKLGFAIIDTMETSFADTIAIMAKAKLIVGGTGNHSSYLVFCQPGTEYIELVPVANLENPGWTFNYRVFTHSGVKRHKVPCPSIETTHTLYKTEWSYQCDLNQVERAIRESPLFSANRQLTPKTRKRSGTSG